MEDCASALSMDLSKKLLTEEIDGIEIRLNLLHEKIVNWDSDQSMIWERDSDESSEFLQVVSEVQQLSNELSASAANNELICYADTTLQMAMARLEEEFSYLMQYIQPLDLEQVQLPFMEDELSDDLSSSSFDEEAILGKCRHESCPNSVDYAVSLVHPDTVYDLKCIAKTMFLSKYDKECCQTYIGARKLVLDECLSVLGVEKLSIEEVLLLDWASLNSMIKRWNRAFKVFVRVYLSSEIRLFDLIFGDFSAPSLRQSCFVEISKSSFMQILNLGEAIAVGPLQPEKLFRILDMYEGLSDLRADIESLFLIEFGSFILNECNEAQSMLGECARGIFAEFKFAIQKNTSTIGFLNGGVHPLTKYVMNYIRALSDYSATINMLFKKEQSGDLPPVATNFQLVTSILESNLIDRSILYTDNALQSLFLMNNICYMVQKVKDSDLRPILGDDWIRSNSVKLRQHAINYERVSWNPVLVFLKDEGVYNHGSNSPSKTVLKERFRSFNQAFEEVYRAQTGWSVPNVDLREDLRISISLKILQAYRTFIGRYAGHLDAVRHRERYIKYYGEDLELALLDLFEGTMKVMHPLRR